MVLCTWKIVPIYHEGNFLYSYNLVCVHYILLTYRPTTFKIVNSRLSVGRAFQTVMQTVLPSLEGRAV